MSKLCSVSAVATLVGYPGCSLRSPVLPHTFAIAAEAVDAAPQAAETGNKFADGTLPPGFAWRCDSEKFVKQVRALAWDEIRTARK